MARHNQEQAAIMVEAVIFTMYLAVTTLILTVKASK